MISLFFSEKNVDFFSYFIFGKVFFLLSIINHALFKLFIPILDMETKDEKKQEEKVSKREAHVDLVKRASDKFNHVLSLMIQSMESIGSSSTSGDNPEDPRILSQGATSSNYGDVLCAIQTSFSEAEWMSSVLKHWMSINASSTMKKVLIQTYSCGNSILRDEHGKQVDGIVIESASLSKMEFVHTLKHALKESLIKIWFQFIWKDAIILQKPDPLMKKYLATPVNANHTYWCTVLLHDNFSIGSFIGYARLRHFLSDLYTFSVPDTEIRIGNDWETPPGDNLKHGQTYLHFFKPSLIASAFCPLLIY